MLQDKLGLACQQHTEITGYTIGAQTHTNPTSTNNFAYLTGRNFGLVTTGGLELSRSVGLAFAVAASTLCPLLVLGIWWRGLTAFGAASGLVVGGLLSGTAVTLAVAKRKGANAITVAHQVNAKLATVRPVLLPGDLQVTVTRNYGETAAEKSNITAW